MARTELWSAYLENLIANRCEWRVPLPIARLTVESLAFAVTGDGCRFTTFAAGCNLTSLIGWGESLAQVAFSFDNSGKHHR
jgi:hypothetical protein